MRVLLAGATGDLGRHILPLLVEAGHEVTGVTRTRGTLEGSAVREIVADLTDRASFLAAVEGLNFDAVIHEITALRKAPVFTAQMNTTNRLRMEGTSTLIAAARATGATKFIAASAISGYGLVNHGDTPLTETAPFGEPTHDHLDPMIAALQSLEQQVRAFGGVTLRYGIIYSAAGPIPLAASDGTGVLPFVHVSDAAAATVLALEKGRSKGVYNIVDDTPATWKQVHEARAIVAGTPLRALPSWLLRIVAPFGAQLMASTSMVVSNARAKRQLGWRPKYRSYPEGLAATLAGTEPLVPALPPYVEKPVENVPDVPAAALVDNEPSADAELTGADAAPAPKKRAPAKPRTAAAPRTPAKPRATAAHTPGKPAATPTEAAPAKKPTTPRAAAKPRVAAAARTPTVKPATEKSATPASAGQPRKPAQPRTPATPRTPAKSRTPAKPRTPKAPSVSSESEPDQPGVSDAP